MKPEVEELGADGIGIVKKVNQKMKPFSKKNKGKYKFVNSENVSNRRSKKLQVKNANRSMKKGYRQQLKKELETTINTVTE